MLPCYWWWYRQWYHRFQEQKRKSGQSASWRTVIHSEHHSKRNSIHKYQQKDYISIPLFTLKPASHIRQTHTQSSTEYSIGSEIQSVEIEVWIPIMVDIITVSWHFINQNHCNDNAVNGIGFTENVTTFHKQIIQHKPNQVLWSKFLVLSHIHPSKWKQQSRYP